MEDADHFLMPLRSRGSGRDRASVDRRRHGMTKPIPMLARLFYHDEDYAYYVGYFVRAPD